MRGSKFKVSGESRWVHCSGLRVQGSGCMVQASKFGAPCSVSGVRMQDLCLDDVTAKVEFDGVGSPGERDLGFGFEAWRCGPGSNFI